jgi:primary-amine oxidase
MPVEYTGFLLVPYGFFERNPALDVPPAPAGACHAPGGSGGPGGSGDRDDACGDGGCGP